MFRIKRKQYIQKKMVNKLKVNKLNVGIEIECILDNSYFDINVGEYHDGHDFGLGCWTAERDGSLDPSDSYEFFDEEGTCVEFVSGIYNGKKRFLEEIDGFIKFFSKNGSHELNEVMIFNESCGSHLHFSLKDNYSFNKKTHYKIFQKLREDFFKKIKKSKIKSKNEILEHYFRDYAKDILKVGNFKYWKSERESEFNILSEIRGHGIEWRSLNLRDIETWKDFKEFWKIVYSCIEKFHQYALKYEVKEEIILIEKKELLDIKEKYGDNKIKMENSHLEGISFRKRYSRQNIEMENNYKFESEELEHKLINEVIECVI